jgi:O-antigen/teichoic acid export membrane protein
MEETVEKSIETKSKTNIRLGTVLGYVALLVNVAYGLFFTPWIISSIGKSVYGVYTIVNTLISLFLVDFGLSTTTNVFLSKYRAQGKIEEAKRFAQVVFKIYIILDAIIFAAFACAYFLIPYIYKGLTDNEIVLLKNSFLIVAAFSLISFPSSLFTGILQSYEKFIAIKTINIASKLATMGLTALFLVLGWSVYGVVAAHAIAGMLAIIAQIILTLKTPIRASPKTKITRDLFKAIVSFSLYTALASLGSRLVFVTIPTILGVVSNSNEIAEFGIVTTLEQYVYLFSTVMSGLFIPKIMREREKTKDPKRLEALAIRVGRIQLFVIGLIFVGFLSCGNEFLEIWMSGEDFGYSYIGLLLIIVYQLLFIPLLIYNTAATADPRAIKRLAVFYLIRGVAVSGLAFLFGWLWGSIGACISIATIRLLGFPIEWVIYHKYLGVTPGKFYKDVYISFIPGFLVASGVGLALHFFLPIETLYKFLAIGAATVVVYSALSIAFLPKGIRAHLLDVLRKQLLHKEISDSDRLKIHENEKKASSILLLIGAACLASYIVFLGIDLIVPTIGVCGTYYCYAVVPGESEATLIETLSVYSVNRCSHTYYVKEGTRLSEPYVYSCGWKMRYALTSDFNTDSDVEYKSTYVFSFENSNGVSWYQLYYCREEGAFYDKMKSQYYGDAQLVYRKGDKR